MLKHPVSILAVDDEETLLHTLERIVKAQGYFVNTASDGRAAINILETLPFDVVLLDVMMPEVGGIEVLKYIKDHHLETEVIMVTAVQDVKTAVECMSLGAFYYITKPYVVSDLMALVERASERKRLMTQNRALKRQIAHLALPSGMVGTTRAVAEMLDLALRVAPTDDPVLIQGATGTGKEVVANFVHVNSRRSELPFVTINFSSHAEELLEKELFGFEKGVMEGESSSRQGLLEVANGGSILLDQVSEMPLALQPKILLFLQTGEFRRVGGNRVLRSDVRVIASTTSDLQREVDAHRFLDELLLRLNTVTLSVPTLRDRKGDIPVLVEQFLKDIAGSKQPKKLTAEALEELLRYEWPGNVRELENIIYRAAILADGEKIDAHHLNVVHRLGVAPKRARVSHKVKARPKRPQLRRQHRRRKPKSRR
jgi:DNA-binding NtrC family response regulator